MKNEIMKRLTFKSGKRLPMIFQAEITECGLACLAMIASYYGHQIDILSLRRQFSVSLKGNTLKDLMEIGKNLYLSSRALKLDLSHLKNLKTPCILHWDLDHFVVLKRVKGNTVIIHDPAVGIVKYPLSKVSEHFTGIAMEMTPLVNFEKRNDKTRLRLFDLWSSFAGLKLQLVQILLIALAMEIFEIVSPLFIQFVTDEVIAAKDFPLLYVLTLGFGLLVLLQGLTTYVRAWIILFVSNSLIVQLVGNLMHHLLRLPLDFFEKRHMGDIVSRFSSLTTIQEKLSTDFVVGIVDGVMLIITLMMMLLYSPLLTAIVVMALVSYIVIRICLYPLMKLQTQESIIAAAKEQSMFMETVRAILPLKIFCQETQRENVWQNCYADKLNTEIRLSKLNLIYRFLMTFIFGLEHILIIFLGAQSIMETGNLTIGMLIAYLAYRQQFVTRAQDMIDKIVDYQMVKVHLERIADIALTTPEKTPLSLLGANKVIKGDLEVKDLAFRYSEQEPYLFKNLSFSVKAGETLAIIGQSGCGKTTLLKVLMNLLAPSSGHTYVDGVEIRKIGLHTYRSQIAAVMQEDSLLSGSIADNICFFDPTPDFNRLYTCAMIAAIHDEIINMPMAYESLVGDMGSALSGGQKQRILLARALYHQPKILFLDEATSHLDIRKEGIVNEHIKKIGITRIIISHRKEIKSIADQVIDFEDLL